MSELHRQPGFAQRQADWIRSLPREEQKEAIRKIRKSERRLIRRIIPLLILLLGLFVLGCDLLKFFLDRQKP